MKKTLFLIHDLGPGGAEKVLVNLVNNMDREQFDITVMSLFGGGVNELYLKDHIRYLTVFSNSFPGNSHMMKLLSPEALHRWFIKEHYDIEIAYLEGPSARVISGCTDPNTKLASWIHSTQASERQASRSFRSVDEARKCYNAFDRIVGVSEKVRDSFLAMIPYSGPTSVIYNTNESDEIRRRSTEETEPELLKPTEIKLVGMGKLDKVKGFDRLLRILGRLRSEDYPAHLYLLGEGKDRGVLGGYVSDNGLTDAVTFLGYQTNPYKYVAKCDLFVCSSYSEGFSTATTEALIVGTPVITTEVSGMREMLGDDEYGIVTTNDEEALYIGIKRLLDDPVLLAHYRAKAAERGRAFSREKTVKAVEDMLLSL